MRSTVLLAFIGAASASAIIPQIVPILPRDAPESYNLTLWAWTHSHHRGSLHTLADGQLRLGDGSIPIANFTFRPGVGIVDSEGRGCITTPGPTNQFQCDEGVKPMPEFDLGCSGQLLFNGSQHFWACAVNDKGVQNVYTEPVPKQLKCVYITLLARYNPELNNRTGCQRGDRSESWIYPWDKFYNNSNAALPSTPEGTRQIASYLKDNQHASSNATMDRPKAEHGIQSPDGRCGSPTGFNCFGKTDGPCCSHHGWCGISASHCGTGCQGNFGICDDASSGKASNGTSVSSEVASKASSTGKAPSSTSTGKAPSSTSTGKAPSSTSNSKAPSSISSKAPSKTSSTGKALSSASLNGTASSSTAPASSHISATSAPKQGTLSPNGQCGGDQGYHCHGSGAGWIWLVWKECVDHNQGAWRKDGLCCSQNPNEDYEVWLFADHFLQPSGNATSPTYTSKPLPSQSANNGTYPPALDCNDPVNAQNCGSSYPAYGCPHNLKGTFESPRLMVTVNKVDPDKALDNKWDGHIGSPHCSLYSFNVSSSYADQKCSLVWLFPEERYLDNSTLFITEPNKTPVMEFWHLRQPARRGMTWNEIGPRKIVAAGPVRPGFSCNAKTVPCPAGFEHTFMVCGDHFYMKYAQDLKSPNPMGLFIRTC
ncbi:carbohydrate-binding module family 18 protein [Karstenula rhodostoma CBS 690.94]|uniref:Carbohydrate-binding module family 18 protein n=1 Tax=Karstenula rhodostoma CBS 690.94 TaxID=1392251 RepID=A0A9P4P973_9PLEO|nr:carbohydrate-binding module family 18 protein [Karstenula rhodostoma CBS 690.94]